MMLLCCSFSSASFTARNPSSLSESVDHLNSEICTICRASFSATPSRHLSRKQFTKKDSGSRLYRASWLFLTGIVTSISCAFSVRSSFLQILRHSSRRHSVLMLLSLSSVTNLSLLFGFCAACMLSYRCLQMEWWANILKLCRGQFFLWWSVKIGQADLRFNHVGTLSPAPHPCHVHSTLRGKVVNVQNSLETNLYTVFLEIFFKTEIPGKKIYKCQQVLATGQLWIEKSLRVRYCC